LSYFNRCDIAYTVNRMIRRKNRSGFTLLELLIVIGIMGVLSSIVVVAINPAEQFERAKVRKLVHEASQLEKALAQYAIDEGSLPSDTPTLNESDDAEPICKQGVSSSECISLDSILIPDYLSEIPLDDYENNSDYSGYVVYKDLEGQPHVSSAYVTCWSDGLVGKWKFNDGQGSNLSDSSRNEKHGTLTDMDPATDWVESSFGDSNSYALDFDGVNDRVLVSSAPALGEDYSFEALVYPNRSGNEIFASRGLPYFRALTTRMHFSWRDTSSTQRSLYTSSGDLPLNQWSHVFVTTDGTYERIYINGDLSIQSSTYDSISVPISNLVIGNYTSGSYWFDGQLDDIAFYDRELSPSEIARVYKCRGY
jgi:prepilin-type N-terminal cleavage/methylation domain-containing protein